jgi:folate-binding protein YgfZ
VDAYAAARDGAGLLELPDRAIVGVSGPLRQKFLHNILSNDVLSRSAGQGCRAAIMDVKGHLVSFLRVLAGKDEILLETAGGTADAVETLLLHYKVAAPVRFRRDDAAVMGVIGSTARAALRAAGADLPELAEEAHVEATVGGAPVRIARAGDLPAGGYVLHVPRESAAAVRGALAAAGVAPVPDAVVDALRIEDGRPWFGRDVTSDNLLHETTLVKEYHSPTKGCYVGQEVIARLEARGGHVNKLLRGLRLAAPVEAGATIAAGGKEVGRVTTAGSSPSLGAIAMGYVHRSAADPGTEVDVAGTRGTVARLPLRTDSL